MAKQTESQRENVQYLSPQEVADILRVSDRTIRRECKRGNIQGARRVGRQWRIPADTAYLSDFEPA